MPTRSANHRRALRFAPDDEQAIRKIACKPIEPIELRSDHPVPAWLFKTWELVAPRAPRWALRWIGGFFLRFPIGSRTRRWFLLGVSAIVWDAIARGRYDLVLPIWDPAGAWHWDAAFRSVGLDRVYRGHEGVRRSLVEINEMFTDRSFTVREILDGGETVVMRISVAGRGLRSGAPGEATMSAVARLAPLIVDYYNFRDDDEALREAGFDPYSSAHNASPTIVGPSTRGEHHVGPPSQSQ